MLGLARYSMATMTNPSLPQILSTLPPGVPGMPPTSAEQLLGRLQALQIDAHTVAHVPLFTVEESKALHAAVPGGHSKNLFLKDKGGALFLVVADQDSALDLKALPGVLGCGRVSFAKPALLWEILGVVPGSVTPFALINDTQLRVTPIFERRLLAFDPLHFHPLRNDCTTSLSTEGLLRFVAACGHVPRVLDLPIRSVEGLEPDGADAHL
jgi:Ala-tRNA(Pro) deacylase